MKLYLKRIGLLFGVFFLCHFNTEAQIYSLYGVAQQGGAYGYGAVYRYEYPSGQDTVIHNFNGTDGNDPKLCLLIANDGNLYGTTVMGGASGLGVLYRINPLTYYDTVLINFNTSNGATPKCGMMQASNGLLYASASKGGTYNMGVLYSYDISTLTQTVLYNFSGTDGQTPSGRLIQATNGLLYGHCAKGGLYGDGILFCYNITTGKDSVLFNFNGSNGNQPLGFSQASNGLIYGATYTGGTNNEGVLYSYDPTNGNYAILINFNGPNGAYASGSDAGALFETSNSFLYGVAQMGGTYNHGCLFGFNINTLYDSILFSFSPLGILGSSPEGNGYMQLPGGIMILPVDSGGIYGMGTLLSYNPINGHLTKLLDFNDTNGAYPSTDVVAIINEENGINNLYILNQLSIYPNPNQGKFIISGNHSNDDNEIIIYNYSGSKIYDKIFTKNQNQYEIDLQDQQPGLYLYRILSSRRDMEYTGKIVIGPN